MDTNNQKAPDVFSEGVEGLFNESSADTVYEHHSDNIKAQSAQILDAEVIELEQPSESSTNNSKVRTRSPMSKKKKIIIYIAGGLFAFVALIIVFQPAPESMPVASPEGFSQNSSQIQSRFSPPSPPAPAPMPAVVAPAPAPMPAVVAPAPAPMPAVVAPAPAPMPAVVAPVPAPMPAVVAPVPATPSFQAEPSDSKLADLERQINELKSLLPPVVIKKPSSKSRGPLYLGDAVGVISILEDGLVFRNSSGKFTVVRLNEKYKSYGALISVNPQKSSFITTRGSWSVPK